MSTRGFRVLWVKVNVNKEKHIYLNLPISLYAFEELMDCIMDFLNLACFFVPKNQHESFSHTTVHTIRELMRALITLLNSLTGSEPYDLVEVEAKGVSVSVRIR